MKNSWLFPVVQAMHLIGMAMSVGAIALADFGRLKVTLPLANSATLARWTYAGFAVAGVTGPLMFFADAGRYMSNAAFHWKMALLAVAVVAHFTVRRKAGGRVAAVLSLAAWSGVVLAARAIADFDR